MPNLFCQRKYLLKYLMSRMRFKRQRMLLSFQERAEQLDKEHKGTLKKFNTMLRAYKKTFKEIESSKKSHPQQLADNYTHFDYFEDGHELYSGSWIADDDGVRTFNMFGEVLACYHRFFQ